MNRILITALGSFMAISAQSASLCGYTDFFHMVDWAHADIRIASAYSEPQIQLQIMGPRSFIMKDTEACQPGYASVTVGYDNDHWCVLNIKDGPYINHPIITADCKNMRYLGMDQDGVGSYSYTLHFE